MAASSLHESRPGVWAEKDSSRELGVARMGKLVTSGVGEAWGLPGTRPRSFGSISRIVWARYRVTFYVVLWNCFLVRSDPSEGLREHVRCLHDHLHHQKENIYTVTIERKGRAILKIIGRLSLRMRYRGDKQIAVSYG